jgi:hypothetical protein
MAPFQRVHRPTSLSQLADLLKRNGQKGFPSHFQIKRHFINF